MPVISGTMPVWLNDEDKLIPDGTVCSFLLTQSTFATHWQRECNVCVISLLGHEPIHLYTMDWQLPDIGKTITNNILPIIFSAYMVSIWRFHSVSIWRFHQCIDRLKSVVSVSGLNMLVRSRSLGYAMICT